MESEIEQLCWLYAKKKEVIGVDFKSLVPEITKPERYTHLIHPYPAKLLANIPFFILHSEKYCPKDGVVLDPFCGAMGKEGSLRSKSFKNLIQNCSSDSRRTMEY